jgi:S-adenosylmethionine decarboxylase
VKGPGNFFVVNLSHEAKNLLHRSNAGVNSASFRITHLLVGEDAMSSDALFQLGMDLDHGSSTAQTEEKHSLCASHEERKYFFCERDGVRYAGTHLIIDLVRAERLDDLEHIEQTLRRCIEVAGATLLHIHLHHFTPNGGVSGVAVLAESHISIHSWPEYGYAALDVFMCGETNPRAAIEVLKEAFSPRRVVVKEHLRGKEMNRWTAGSKRRSTVASVSA